MCSPMSGHWARHPWLITESAQPQKLQSTLCPIPSLSHPLAFGRQTDYWGAQSGGRSHTQAGYQWALSFLHPGGREPKPGAMENGCPISRQVVAGAGWGRGNPHK